MRPQDVARAKILLEALPDVAEFIQAVNDCDDTPEDNYNDCAFTLSIQDRCDAGGSYRANISIDIVTARKLIEPLAQLVVDHLDEIGVEMPPLSTALGPE